LMAAAGQARRARGPMDDRPIRRMTMPLEIAGEENFGKMTRKLTTMMDQLQKGFFNFCSAETWQPTVNLYETEEAYVVCVDLAGVDKEKIDLMVADNQLRLRGARPMPTPLSAAPGEAEDVGKRVRVHLMEIDHGQFCREVDLPKDVDADKVTAAYRNGMLWVELRKK
jgi:HSP20 family molecular chaperone IbpA